MYALLFHSHAKLHLFDCNYDFALGITVDELKTYLIIKKISGKTYCIYFRVKAV